MSLSLTRLDRVGPQSGQHAVWTPGAWNGDYYVHPLSGTGPHLDFYKRSGKTLTLLPHTPDMTFYEACEALAWNGNILAVGHGAHWSSPVGVTLFRLDGDTLVKLPSFVPLEKRCTNLSWNGNYLAVGHWDAAERITLYRLDGETLVKCGPVDIIPHSTPNNGALKWNGDYLLAGFSTAPFQKLYKLTGDTLSFVKNNEEPEALRIFNFQWNGNYYVACQSGRADLWLFDPLTESFDHQSSFTLTGSSASITGVAWRDDYLLVTAYDTPSYGAEHVGLYERQGSNLVLIDGNLAMPNCAGGPYPPAWGEDLIAISYYDSLFTQRSLMLYEITDLSIPPGGLTVEGESPDIPFVSPFMGWFSIEGQAPTISPVSVGSADLNITGHVPATAEIVALPDPYQMTISGLAPGIESTGGIELTGTTPGIDGAWTFGDEWFISSTAPHVTGSFQGGAHIQGKTPEIAGQFIVEAEVAGYFAGKTATVTGFATGGGFFQGKQGAIAGTWGAEAGDTLNIGSFAGKSPEMGGSIIVTQAGTFKGATPAAVGVFAGEMEQYGSFTGKAPMPTGLFAAPDRITFSFSGRTPVPVFSGSMDAPEVAFSGYTPQINGGAFTAGTTHGTAPAPAITEDQIIRYRRGYDNG